MWLEKGRLIRSMEVEATAEHESLRQDTEALWAQLRSLIFILNATEEPLRNFKQIRCMIMLRF